MNERLTGYFESLSERIGAAHEELDQAEQTVERLERFLKNPTRDGLREELQNELRDCLPIIGPGKLSAEDLPRFSSALLALSRLTPNINALRQEDWQALWCKIDPEQPADIAAFHEVAKQSPLFSIGARPRTDPQGIQLHGAWYAAHGADAELGRMLEAETLLVEFEKTAKTIGRL